MPVILMLLLGVSAAQAAVYRSIGPDGRVTYSDRPEEGAEKVDLPPLQTFPALPVPDETKQDEEEPAFEGYTEFEIVAPEDNATLRDNQGNVSVRLKLSPGLQGGHKIDIFMDGQSLGGGGRSTALSLSNVDRGTHVVHAAVKDAKGKEVARTPPVTFHLHRQSRLTPAKPAPVPGAN